MTRPACRGESGGACLARLDQTEQVYRAGTDVVAVRTSVRRDGKPVLGLSPNDFVVLDNGEARPVDVVDAGTVPVDLAVVVDQGAAATLWHDGFTRELEEIPGLLRPGDRVSVTIIAEGLAQIIHLGPGERATPVTLRPGVPTLLDAIARELIVPVPAGRQRNVLMVGVQNHGGVIDYEAMLRLARATPARLDIALGHWQIVNGGVAGTRILRRSAVLGLLSWEDDERRAGLLWSRSRDAEHYFSRMEEDERQRLVAVAEATGGRELAWRGGSLRRAVEEVLTETREGYVLYFRPSASAAPGWHALEVQVPGQARLRITARAAYIK